MDTYTSLMCSALDAEHLAELLMRAAKKAGETGEVQNVTQVMEQDNATGPWRLIIHVVANDMS